MYDVRDTLYSAKAVDTNTEVANELDDFSCENKTIIKAARIPINRKTSNIKLCTKN